LKMDAGYLDYVWSIGDLDISKNKSGIVTYSNTVVSTTTSNIVTVTVPSLPNVFGYFQPIVGFVSYYKNPTCYSSAFISSTYPIYTPIVNCGIIQPPCGDSIQCTIDSYMKKSISFTENILVSYNVDSVPISSSLVDYSELGNVVSWNNNIGNNVNSFEFYYPSAKDTSFTLRATLPNKCNANIYTNEFGFGRQNLDTNSFTAAYCIDKISDGVKLVANIGNIHFVRWRTITLDTLFDTLYPPNHFDKKTILGLVGDTTAGAITFRPNTPGSYDLFGVRCVDTLGKVCCGGIHFKICVADCIEPFISNALSPNNDNVNDTWNIINIKNPPEVVVFSRWGDKIFEDKAYKNNWEGLDVHNKPLPDGVYLYSVNVNSNTFYSSDSLENSGPNASIEPKALLQNLGYNPDSLLSVNQSDSLLAINTAEYNKLVNDLFTTGLRYKNDPRPDLWKLVAVQSSSNSSSPASLNSGTQNQLVYNYYKTTWQCKYKSVQSKNGTLLIQR
jgi:gliding motility-associated-like protein